MTFLEKAKKDNPNIKLKDSGTPMACPFELGYEEDYDCEEVTCINCWNREMPNTELEKVKEAFSKVGKAISKASEDVYKEDMNTAYNKGLNDGRNEVWELVNKVYSIMSCTKVHEVFNCKDLGDVLREYSPQEALAKLKAYEEAQEQNEVEKQIAELELKIEELKKKYVSKD